MVGGGGRGRDGRWGGGTDEAGALLPSLRGLRDGHCIATVQWNTALEHSAGYTAARITPLEPCVLRRTGPLNTLQVLYTTFTTFSEDPTKQYEVEMSDILKVR